MSKQSEAFLYINPELFNEVLTTYGSFFNTISRVDQEKITRDVLSQTKVDEQVTLIERESGESLRGKKVLEIGSGYGLFVLRTIKKYGAITYGVEPSSEGFRGSLDIACEIARDNAIDSSVFIQGEGEALPFPAGSFDIIYSTNVFEHVNNPSQCFNEAIRVCKQGGFIQIVIPNYGSFYEGHYACWYVPYTPKRLWKLVLRYILNRNTGFADTLHTELNYFTVRNMLKPYVKSNEIEILNFGESIFSERMAKLNFTPYAGLYKVIKIVHVLQHLGMTRAVTKLLLLTKAHSPLVVSIRKK